MKKPLRRITKSPNHQIHSGCFITGTDTGVGKTLVTAALALCLTQRGLTVGVMKPIETGCRTNGASGSDAARLYAAAGVTEPVEAISPYRFADPLAPLDAARRAGRTIDLRRIIRAYRALAARYAFLLVEGAGGVMVPITPTTDTRDVIAQLGLPAVVVVRAMLGAVNHTLLTLDALRHRRIPVLGVFLNRSGSPSRPDDALQETSTIWLLKARCGVPVIGPLPHRSEIAGSWEQGLAEIAESPAIRELADLVSGTTQRTSGRSR